MATIKNRMDNNTLYYKDADQEVYRKFMRDVYTWIAVGLVLTALSALVIVMTPVVYSKIGTWSGVLLWLSWVISAGWIGYNVNSMSFSEVVLSSIFISVLSGAFAACLYKFFYVTDIIDSFIVVFVIFAGMSLQGYVTKKMLTGFSLTACMYGIGLITALLCSVFIHPLLHASVLTLVVVSFLILCSVDNTREMKGLMLRAETDGNIGNMDKVALYGSLVIFCESICLPLYGMRSKSFKCDWNE